MGLATLGTPAVELVELLRADELLLAGDLGVTSYEQDISNEEVSNALTASPTAAAHALTASPTAAAHAVTRSPAGRERAERR